MLIILGLVAFFCVIAVFALFSDPARIDAEESRRVWRKARAKRAVRRARNVY
jgi:hypothetical protein